MSSQVLNIAVTSVSVDSTVLRKISRSILVCLFRGVLVWGFWFGLVYVFYLSARLLVTTRVVRHSKEPDQVLKQKLYRDSFIMSFNGGTFLRLLQVLVLL